MSDNNFNNPDEQIDYLGQDNMLETTPDDYLSFETVQSALHMGEAGDADLLAGMFIDRIAFDHSEACWYLWDGNFWQPDRTGEVYRLVTKEIAPQYLQAAALAQADGKDKLTDELVKRAYALRNRKRAENILFLSARDSNLALTGEEWDRDPWILGVGNGVIELRTGAFRPGRPGDFIRAHSPVNWQGLDAPAPRWKLFLQEILADDLEMVEFVHRLLGYQITGVTTEHILPILCGEDGRNGKSTLVETLGSVLGRDIATSTQADTLMDNKYSAGQGPQPFVYALRGKRLVWASESSEGRKINAGLVKQLTGGDRLNVRTLHSRPVEFKASHKIMLLTNRKPHMPADDQAIWDRVLLIAFTLRFIDEPMATNERRADKDLSAELLKEAPGILAWLVGGCLDWQTAGLKPPAKVKMATEKYREEEDVLARFLLEKCVQSPEEKIRANALYLLYQTWAKDNGEFILNNTVFGRRMTKKFDKVISAGAWYVGVGESHDL